MKKVKRFATKYALVIVFAVLVITFGIVNPNFFTPLNLMNLVKQNTHILLVAVGISFVMMSGTLDLSVGYQLAIVGVLTGRLMTAEGLPVWLAVVIGLAVGMLLGLINGGCAVIFKIDPMIVTIAMMTVFNGAANLLGKGLSYNNFPETFRVITRGTFLGLNIDIWIAIVAIAIVSFVYNKTYFGRFVKSMGGNEEATRLAGVNTKSMRVITFVICGFFVAIAAMINISKLSIVNTQVGPGTEFTALTAAILGGVSFNSGEGKMWGLVMGVFTLAIISNGMQLAGWNQYIQYIIQGIILVLAIGFDHYQRSHLVEAD